MLDRTLSFGMICPWMFYRHAFLANISMKKSILRKNLNLE